MTQHNKMETSIHSQTNKKSKTYIRWFLLLAFLIGVLIGHILWNGETLMPGGGDPSPSLPPAGLILSWYRKVSNTLSWLIGILLIAFVIRIIGCIAEGLSAIQPDIVDDGTPFLAPSATAPHPTETAEITGSSPQHLTEAPQMTIESPIENTTQNVSANGEPQEILAVDSPPEQPSYAGVKDQLELFKALEKRWQEFYGGQTPAEVREQVHRRLLAASAADHSLEVLSSNHPRPPQIPSPSHPGLGSLLEEVGAPESRPSGAPGGSSSIVIRKENESLPDPKLLPINSFWNSL